MSAEDLRNALALPRTVTGGIPNKYPVGWALSSLPWYGLGSLTTRLLNWTGAHRPLDGYGPWYQLAIFVGQLFYALLGLMVAYWLIRQWLPAGQSLAGLTLTWLGSFLVYYQASNLSMSHNLNFLAQMSAYACTYRLAKAGGGTGWAVAVGAFSALAILARYQSVVLLIYPLFTLFRISGVQRSGRWLIWAALGGGVVLLTQLVAWKMLYGSFLLYSYQGESFNWSHPHFLEVLFSPWHGLLYWHPLLIFGLVGFADWCRRERSAIACCWVVSLVLEELVNGAWGCWWFGSSFGSRAFDGCIFFAMLGLAHLFRCLGQRPLLQTVVACLVALLVTWNIQLAWLARKDWLNLERPVSHSQMVATAMAFWQGIPASEWRKTH